MATFLIFLLVGAVLAVFFYLFTRDAYRTGYGEGWNDCQEQIDYPTTHVRLLNNGRDAA